MLKQKIILDNLLVINLIGSKFHIRELLNLKNKIPNLHLVQHINPLEENSVESLKEFIAIKLHPRIDTYPLDNKKVLNLINSLDPKKQFVVVCSFWDGSWHKYNLAIEQFFHLAEAFPNHKFLFAHAGGIKTMDFILMAKRVSNVYLDFSFTQHYFPQELIFDEIRYGCSTLGFRVFFGSDFENLDYIVKYESLLKMYKRSISRSLLQNYFQDNLNFFLRNYT